ncbi:hypothetical protein Mapa_002187 [Marchantia paleacea]|nr:hypothetical protein Mapa_002187 [Marchantia paleacea]
MKSVKMAYLRRLNGIARHLECPSAISSHLKVGESTCSGRKARPIVIGGMVLDIQATPVSHDIQPGTTTPGEVCYVRGGVGRNIAECMAKLDTEPFLISVVGDDLAGNLLIEHWRSHGLPVNGIRVCVGTSTPVISAVFDRTGELTAAVADTRAVEDYLTVEWILKFTGEFQSASVVLIDANLDPPVIKLACKLASNADVPVWFEPVSVAKSVRATDCLSAIAYISPNEAELVAMANALHPTHFSSQKRRGSMYLVTTGDRMSRNNAFAVIYKMKDCIRKLLHAGVKYVVLTVGSVGAVWCSMDPAGEISCLHYPALQASVVKLSGAGDSLVAGTLAALSNNITTFRALAYGMAAAKLTVESDMNVAQTLSWTAISDHAEALLLLEIKGWGHLGERLLVEQC